MHYWIMCHDVTKPDHEWVSQSEDHGKPYDDPAKCSIEIDKLNLSIKALGYADDLAYTLGVTWE